MASISLLYIMGKSLGFILCLYKGNISLFLFGLSKPTLNFTGKYQQNQVHSASKTIAGKMKISLCRYFPAVPLVFLHVFLLQAIFLSTSILLLFVLFSYFPFLNNHIAVLIGVSCPFVSIFLLFSCTKQAQFSWFFPISLCFYRARGSRKLNRAFCHGHNSVHQPYTHIHPIQKVGQGSPGNPAVTTKGSGTSAIQTCHLRGT